MHSNNQPQNKSIEQKTIAEILTMRSESDSEPYMAASSITTASLKLLIDTKSRKVLFAEADKHFCQQSMDRAVPYVEKVFQAKAGRRREGLSNGW
ncbi:hypothetical protein LguiB_029560 [Lonicera macranthoides]